MNKNWKIQTNPKADPENILQGEKYRITMLTEGLVRLEYSEEGIFEDRATQSQGAIRKRIFISGAMDMNIKGL